MTGEETFNLDGSSFTVKANKKIGSVGTEDVDYITQVWDGSEFTYTTDGAFYAIRLTNETGAVEFNKVFDNFTIQTEGSQNAQSYNQDSTGRKGGDFGSDSTHGGTKIYADNTNDLGTLYYGIHSGIFGVNFEKDAQVTIKLSGELLDNAKAGNYKITVDMYAPTRANIETKHADAKELESFKLGSVEFTFEVK